MGEPLIPIAEAVINVVGTKWRMNKYTFLDEETGFVYFAAPAAANVRTNGSLQKGLVHLRGQRAELSSMKPLNNRDADVLNCPNDVGMDVFGEMLEDDSVIKFAFVRDPVERFAAIYRNQFSINTKHGAQRVKLFEHLGISLEENLPLVDLAEILTEEDGLYSVSPPLVPQRRMIAYDLVDFDFIGRHEQWETDFPAIAMEIFGCETPLFDPVKELNIDPEGTKLFSLVDEDTRMAVMATYAEDYEMLDEIKELFPDGFRKT